MHPRTPTLRLRLGGGLPLPMHQQRHDVGEGAQRPPVGASAAAGAVSEGEFAAAQGSRNASSRSASSLGVPADDVHERVVAMSRECCGTWWISAAEDFCSRRRPASTADHLLRASADVAPGPERRGPRLDSGCCETDDEDPSESTMVEHGQKIPQLQGMLIRGLASLARGGGSLGATASFAHPRSKPGRLSATYSRSKAALCLVMAIVCGLWQPAGSWIALSKDGYTIKHNLIAEAGVTVSGDMRVNGVLMSKPVENIACTPERAGSMRWNDKYFESCDGVNDWQPVQFCDRSCEVNAHAVPCGVAVLNKCGVDCDQTGTGLNMRQCLLRTATSKCNEEVVDNCGNPCGILGQFDCDSTEVQYGAVTIKSLDAAPSTAGFEFTVGADGSEENRDSLFMTYKNMGGISQALTMMRRVADADSGDTGLEFAKPPGQPQATMRISMLTELTGELIELGKSSEDSQLFIDGVIDKECPFVFSGGLADGNVTKLCLETPTHQRTLTLPDASGTVITSGNREDISNLPGLSGDNTLVFTGGFRDLDKMRLPPKPRVSCANFSCSASSIRTPDGGIMNNCSQLDYAAAIFDVLRVYYVMDEGRSVNHLPLDHQQKISFASDAIRASTEVRQALKNFWAPYANATAEDKPRLELLLRFLRMTVEDSGIDLSGALHEQVDVLIRMRTFGDVADIERCFVCCGGDQENATVSGLVPPKRSRPYFCIGGDKDGSVCQPSAPHCPGGGACVDDPAMSCYEHDFGMKCFDLTSRPNFTTTVNFTEPTAQRQLLVPDASGTFISTGNLEDITSVGVLTSSIVSQSTNTTTTTLQFERCQAASPAACGMRQVSSVLQNNTLLVPSAADGILLTTGNLEDVTLDSGSMSGLSVATDVQINGLLQFGEASTAGIRLPPRLGSQHYSTPSGNQHPGNVNLPGSGRGPGQLSFLLERDGQAGTTRVFEFEPRDATSSDSARESFLTVPARNGTAISTGNLESVTKESGSMTSLSVGGSSYLEGGLSLGKTSEYGQQTLVFQGSVEETIVHSNPIQVNKTHHEVTGEPAAGDRWSTTKLGFQMQPGAHSSLTMPATSGTIITTGNLEDVSEFTGQLLNVSGAAHLRGPVRLGSNRSTAISFAGYLEGDIVSRSAPRRRDRGTNVEHVPPPNSWGHLDYAYCDNGVPAEVLSDTGSARRAAFATWERYGGRWNPLRPDHGLHWTNVGSSQPLQGRELFNTALSLALASSTVLTEQQWQAVGISNLRYDDYVKATDQTGPSYFTPTLRQQTWGDMSSEFLVTDGSVDRGILVFDSAPSCRQSCLARPDKQCGIVVRSRHLRGSIRLVANSAADKSSRFLTATPLSAPDWHSGCPDYGFGGATLEGAAWAGVWECQRAAVLDMDARVSAHLRIQDLWGKDYMALADIDVVVARCQNSNGQDWMPCWDMEMCAASSTAWHSKTCEVSFRQHFTGGFLGTQAGVQCYAHGAGADAISSRKPIGFDDAASVCTGWRAEATLWRFEPNQGQQALSRVGICAEIEGQRVVSDLQPVSARITCDWSWGHAPTPEASYLDGFQTFEWGMGITGVCGAYNASGVSVVSCVQSEDEARWQNAALNLCQGAGCYVSMSTAGEIEIVRADATGQAHTPHWQPQQDLEHTERFQPAARCRLQQTRVVFQARCKRERYMDVLNVNGDESFQVVASLTPEGEPQKGAFQLSTLQVMKADMTKEEIVPLHHECWLSFTRGPNCLVETHMSWDVDFYIRDEATRLTFAAPSDSQTQWFPDVDGTIITSGNVDQISHLRGLEGANSFIFASGSEPGDATTIIDFAAMGTAPSSRKRGLLPQYQTPDGSLAHEYPSDGGVRLVFPDATGTVITTGNTDDLVFKSINLEGLEVQLEANFGESTEGAEPTILNLGASSRVTGCFNFVETEGDTAYTQLCAIPPTRNNRIDLPDVSGVVLTTGNLLGLPNIKIPDEHMFVGGDLSLEGSIELGHADKISTMELFTWIDGDVGLTLQSAGGMLDEAAAAAGDPGAVPGRKISTNSIELTVPHMSGLDRAMRAYLAREAKNLPVDVQHEVAFRSPVSGTHRVNQSVCSSLLTDLNVGNYHALGYYLTAHDVLVPTLLRGRPYAAILNSSDVEVFLPLDNAGRNITCHGDQGADCSNIRFTCGDSAPSPLSDEGGKAEAGQRNRAAAAGHGRPGGFFSLEDSRCVFDGDISTNFESSHVSSVAFRADEPIPGDLFSANPSTHTGRCVLGMVFSSPRALSRFRMYVRKGYGSHVVGARLQGWRSSNVSSAGGVWDELFLFERPLREEEWNDVDLSTAGMPTSSPSERVAARSSLQERTTLPPADYGAYSRVRFLGAACGVMGQRNGLACRCDIAEMEWHHGFISQNLSPLELGARSYFVSQENLQLKAQVAMVLKCAYKGWYPKHLIRKQQELALPETSGHMLTTGNLRDITIEAGAMSSLGVKGDVLVAGDSVFGAKDKAASLEINSNIEGRFPLSLAHASSPAASVTLSVPDPTGDSYIHLPDESGTIVTTGSLPGVVDKMVVVGGATLKGKVRMQNDVVIGDKLKPGILEVHSPLASSFPLTFGGASPANERLSLSVEAPTDDRVLVLPDASGTLLTSGSMPNVLESTSFTGESIFHGGASFLHEDVVLGTRDAAAGARGAATLELNAVLQGSSPLHFEGLSADNRTLSLGVEEPSGRNTITLPDVSGTVITTGNFPDVVERLRILGDATFEGHASLVGEKVRLGRQDTSGKLQINARITGRFPLTFSDADAHGMGGSTTIEITPPTGNNIISFPDATGTVITTGNIPSAVILPDDDYTIQAQDFVAAAPSVAMGVGAEAPKHKGSFVYTDGFMPTASDGDKSNQSGKTPTFTSRSENSFNVRATGGVKFVTGYTPKGRALGVVLSSGSSAWSVLCDRDSKEHIVPVDPRRVLDTLVKKVPISTWSYEGDERVRHIGPMAQDFFDAFGLGDSRRHISSIDADGVAMAALQGLHQVHAQVAAEVRALEDDAERAEKEIRRNAEMLAAQESQLADAESSLASLMTLFHGFD